MEPEQLNFGRRLAYVDRTDRTPGEPCAGKKKTGGGISDKQKGCRRGQGAGRSYPDFLWRRTQDRKVFPTL